MATRILIVDDHGLVRKALRCLLETDPDMRVVGGAPDAWKALKLLRQLSPDVVITNISLSDLSGIELTRRILAARPDVKVLVLSMYDDEDLRLESLEAGASGYLTKGSRPDDLIAAIRRPATAPVHA